MVTISNRITKIEEGSSQLSNKDKKLRTKPKRVEARRALVSALRLRKTKLVASQTRRKRSLIPTLKRSLIPTMRI